MSFVDFEPKPPPQQSFSDWWQGYWQNPHPQGVVAMMKRSLNAVPDMVNASIAATGAAPLTEEEAFRYNLARDRGIIGAFGAASTFGPAAPQFLGAAAARLAAGRAIPQALERPSHLNGSNGNTSSAGVRYRGSQSELPSSAGSVPSVPLPSANPTPSGGLLGRLRELEALERRSPAGNVGPISSEKDPNFRQLSRIVVGPLDVAPSIANGTNFRESLDPKAQDLEASSRSTLQGSGSSDEYVQRADGSDFRGHGGRGGGPGNGGGGGKGGGQSNDDDDAHPCTRRWMDEMDNWCPQFWKAGERWVSACEQRAGDRNSLCWGNGGFPVPGEPDRYSWSDIPRKPIKPYSLRPKK